jgi:hypothetical protein
LLRFGLVGACQGGAQTRGLASGARRRLNGLINKGGFSGDLGETRCATRISNVALEERISRIEMG